MAVSSELSLPDFRASFCRSAGWSASACASPASSSCTTRRAAQNLLASIYELRLATRSGATELRNGRGRSVDRQDPAGPDRAGRRRRRHLAVVHRRRVAGQPAAAIASRPDPAVGLRRPGPGPAGGLPGLPRGRDDPPQLRGRPTASFTLAELGRDDRRRNSSTILRNNAIWLIVGTGGSVGLGLVIAGLFDRVRRESLAKTFVFLPLAISLVGASVIWGFVYAWQPAGQPQIGLLNAIVVGLRRSADARGSTTSPINIFCAIVIIIWLQTGFAMVVLSAAIKGVPTEIIEAARPGWRAPSARSSSRVIVPDDPRLDHHGLDHDRHRRAQGLRHRVRHDRRTLRRRRRRQPDVPRDLPVLRRRPRRRARDTPVRCRPARACSSTCATSDDSRWHHDRDRPAHRCADRRELAAWRPPFAAQPAAAALRSSRSARSGPCRPWASSSARSAIRRTSRHPAGGRRCSTRSSPISGRSNYATVSRGDGMGNAFINSLIVTVPADGHPDHHRRLCGLRVRLDAVPRPGLPVHDRRRRCSSCRSRCR